MPKVLKQTRKCSRCKLRHPITWYRTYKLKDGSQKRSSHCKLCRVKNNEFLPIESWSEISFKERQTEIPKNPDDPLPYVLNPPF